MSQSGSTPRRPLTRRQACLALAAIASTIAGGEVSTAPQGKILRVPLDDISEIHFLYRGRLLVLTPTQILDALK